MLNVSASSLGDFTTCPRLCALKRHFKGNGIESKQPKWYYTYGEIVHIIMEEVVFNPKLYKKPIKIKEQKIKSLLTTLWDKLKSNPDYVYDETHWITEYYKILSTCIAFVRINNHWIIKLKKVEPELGLRAKFRNKYMYNGYLDLVATDEKGNIWIFDWKTPSRLYDSYVDYIQSNSQLRLYFSMLRKKEGYGKKVRGIHVVVLKKTTKRIKQNQSPEEYYKEILEDYLTEKDFYINKITLSNDEVSSLFDEVEALADHYASCLKEFTDDNMSKFYRRSDACDTFGKCEYYPVCWEGGYEAHKRLYKLRKKPA